jgi:hypothetical protein
LHKEHWKTCGLSRSIAADRRSQGDVMSDTRETLEKIPMMQKLLDNPFLLLFLGVLIPMVVYTLWGIIDILTIPPAP